MGENSGEGRRPQAGAEAGVENHCAPSESWNLDSEAGALTHHFTEHDSEKQRREWTCSRSQGLLAGPGPNPSFTMHSTKLFLCHHGRESNC